MALPIKETPILTGKDADEFRKQMENPGSVSKEDYERAKEVPETIICSVCGNVYSLKDKKTSLCKHLFTEISQF